MRSEAKALLDRFSGGRTEDTEPLKDDTVASGLALAMMTLEAVEKGDPIPDSRMAGTIFESLAIALFAVSIEVAQLNGEVRKLQIKLQAKDLMPLSSEVSNGH